MDNLTAASIRAGLGTAFVGREVHFWPEIGSTNDEARHLARAGAPEGTLVIADHQTAGRGRLDRRWEAPPGSSLLLSLILRPALAQAQRLTMACGLAIVEAVEATTGLPVGLKWPNDVVVGEAKLGGILAEIELQGQELAHAVVGVGLNVNLQPAELPHDLLLPATSLAQLLGRAVPRLPLLQALLRATERHILALAAGHSPHEAWAARLVTLGREVTVTGSGPAFRGRAEGVNSDGALLVRRADGRLEAVLAGDVTLRQGCCKVA